MRTDIPEAFQDLLDGPRVAALTTLMPGGSPQTTVVWSNYEPPHVLVNTMRGFRKERNMRADPRVAWLGFDPREPLRYLEVRGRVVDMTETGAMAHLDALCKQYTGTSPYFGACVPAELKERETPVLCRILPTHVVTLDARGPEPPVRVSPAPAPTAGVALPAPAVPIPASHLDLLTRPIHGVLTTLMPGGQPQSSLVWCDYDGACACVNTTRERRKGKNMLADPRVTLLIVDPEDTSRYLEIRGEVEISTEGALEHLDDITRAYTRHPQYYGYVYPREQQARETRIICRIRAKKITLDAIHR